MQQLKDHLEDINISCKFQSAYRMFFSTETALLKVTYDILLNLVLRESTLYIGLYLSAAFDTIDHDILLYVFENSLGIRHHVLSFIRSYLSGRSQKVLIDDIFFFAFNWIGCSAKFCFRPFLFTCYLLPLELIFVELYVNYSFYADDTVFYFVYNSSVTHKVIDSIFGTLQKWFNGQNTKKTEFLKIARKSLMVCDLQLPMVSKVLDNVKFLGFVELSLW